MDTPQALEAFAALSQESRLEIFRLLVRFMPEGLPAGEVARCLEAPQNTISAHLAIMKRAGLVTGERQGRIIVYRVCLPQIRALADFLTDECCAEGQVSTC